MAKAKKRILGIDPGSLHMGVGCVESDAGRLRLLYCTTLHAPPKAPLFERLGFLGARLQQLLDELRPDEVAVEGIFTAKNVRSAISLGTARGLAIGACLRHGLSIHEYAPTQVKSVVTGYGRSDKGQVQKMVEMIVGRKIDLGHDATDAVAIAICHASHVRLGAHA